jgi:hypothetical protein
MRSTACRTVDELASANPHASVEGRSRLQADVDAERWLSGEVTRALEERDHGRYRNPRVGVAEGVRGQIEAREQRLSRHAPAFDHLDEVGHVGNSEGVLTGARRHGWIA